MFYKKYKSEKKKKHGFVAFAKHLFNLPRQKTVSHVLKEQLLSSLGFKFKTAAVFFCPF